MIKLYRGTSVHEANDLLNGNQKRLNTHWCESFEKANMYSKGAVVCLVFDEAPAWIKYTKSVCEGDAAHGTFTQYVIKQKDFAQLWNWAESDSHVTITNL